MVPHYMLLACNAFFFLGGFMDKDMRVFLESICVTIRKFIEDNYDVYYDTDFSKDNKKWRLKHQEITHLPNIVPVPLGFCKRYADLVYQGKIIIVKDEFGRYESYVNPRLIKELPAEQDLISYLKDLGIDGVKTSEEVTKRELHQMAETKKILRSFNGEEQIVYVNNLNNVIRRERKNDKH